jgi:DNA-binding YbaB/EbfC family protein
MRDLMGMMGKMKELQERMQNMQAELERLEVTGVSGGGMVSITLTAKGGLKKVVIDPSLLKPEEKEILEDLIAAAHAEARRKGDALVEEKAKEMTGGLPIPPGLKLF